MNPGEWCEIIQCLPFCFGTTIFRLKYTRGYKVEFCSLPRCCPLTLTISQSGSSGSGGNSGVEGGFNDPVAVPEMCVAISPHNNKILLLRVEEECVTILKAHGLAMKQK